MPENVWILIVIAILALSEVAAFAIVILRGGRPDEITALLTVTAGLAVVIRTLLAIYVANKNGGGKLKLEVVPPPEEATP